MKSLAITKTLEPATHPFYFEVERDEKIEKDSKLFEFWFAIEVCRRGLVGKLEKKYGLPIPTDGMIASEDPSLVYLVDLRIYFKIALELDAKKILEVIMPPKSDRDLVRYYYAHALYANMRLKKELDQKELTNLVEVYFSLKSEELKPHCFNMIETCLARLTPNFFLSDDLIKRLAKLYPQDPATIEEFDAICANIRNRFMLKYYPGIDNSEHEIWKEARSAWTISDFHLAPAIINQTQIEDWPEINIGANFLDPKVTKYQIKTLTVRDVMRYCAHIITPGPVTFCVEIGNLTDVDNENINNHLRKKLFEKGYTNSAGDLIKGKISYGKTSEEKKAAKAEFYQYYSDSLKEYLARHFAGAQFQEKAIKTVIEKKLEQAYKQQQTVRDYLAGFNAVDSISLLYQTLNTKADIPEILKPCLLPEPIRNSLLSTVADTLVVAQKIKEIFNKKILISSMHHQSYCIADDIVTRIKDGYSIVLQTGTPIVTENDENGSKHAFYVIFKKIEGKNQVKIIIVNGGYGIAPEEDTSYDERDRNMGGNWLCRETEPLDLNEAAAEEFLKHYVYRVLVLSYTEADPKLPGHSNIELLENIYFKSSTSFIGDGIKPDYVPTISAKPHSISSQIFGNCTIHNFKFALKILFDWNEASFAHYNADLVCRFNALLRSQDAKIKAAKSSGSGHGMDAAGSGGIFNEVEKDSFQERLAEARSINAVRTR